MKIMLWAVLIGAVLFMLAPLPVLAQTDKWTAPANFTPPLNDITVTSTATLLCPANANQIYCNCRNIGADTMRIGDSTVTASKGLPVQTTETVEVRTRSAVYGVSEGADTTAACLTETQ